jgi:hypothetical protein
MTLSIPGKQLESELTKLQEHIHDVFHVDRALLRKLRG